MIEIKDLSYTIGKKEILKNISFTVNKGSMTCIVGPNGCGKSTLLAHISRRLPSRNSIYYKGCAVETIPRKEYAKEVAVMVQQGFGMAGDLKAEDVVLMGRYPFKGRFSDYTKEDHQIAERVMIETGASILSGREMQHMSGGEKQRILIAKGLHTETAAPAHGRADKSFGCKVQTVSYGTFKTVPSTGYRHRSTP